MHSEYAGPEWVVPLVVGVLDRAFRPGELNRWWLDDESGFGIAQPDVPAPQLWLHLQACGEIFDFRIWSTDRPDDSLDELRARLTSDLQDWIAESRFGWGQQRLIEPDRSVAGERLLLSRDAPGVSQEDWATTKKTMELELDGKLESRGRPNVVD